MIRRLAAVALLLASGAVSAAVLAPAASAHPLGNFTVNYSSGVVVEPAAVQVDQVVDRAEIPTLQAFADAAPGQVPATAAAFQRAECEQLAEGAVVTVDGRRAPLRVTATTLTLLPGAAGLATARLECTLRTEGKVPTVGRAIQYQAPPTGGRVGWHEVTARGDGVRLATSDVPATSPSQQLRVYPADLLSSPLNQRSARLTVTAGTGAVTGESTGDAPQTGVLHGLDRLTTAYTALVSRATLTPGFAVLAVLLSMLLGALHAFAPGHGKTLMAAYLVAREGTWRQAAVIGLSVTVTHTIGVLVLGVVLSAAVLAAPETVYPWLGLVSGLLLAAVGIILLRSPGRLVGGHDHGPADGGESGHGHGHGHGHAAVPAMASTVGDAVTVREPPAPTVGHGHGHGHEVMAGGPAVRRGTTRGAGTTRLVLVGLVGGMVPSPSALLVLLGGIALGRAWFGALLVLFYGIGMAAALVATGLLLVLARDKVELWSARRAAQRGAASPWTTAGASLARWLPRLTAVVVIVVGLSLAARSALTI